MAGYQRFTPKALQVLASTLLAIAVAGIIIAQIGIATSSLSIWHSVVFPDLESVSAFVAAVAAWVSVLANRRSSESDRSRGRGPERDPGLTNNDLTFLHELMERLSDSQGKLGAEEASAVHDAMAQLGNQRIEALSQIHSESKEIEPSAIDRHNGSSVEVVASAIQSLSPEALEMLYVIASSGHLTASQYRELTAHPLLGEATHQLRELGLIVSLEHKAGDDFDRVYWLAPYTRSIVPALLGGYRSNKSVAGPVRAALLDVKYRYDF
jgi:hypothetical protein